MWLALLIVSLVMGMCVAVHSLMSTWRTRSAGAEGAGAEGADAAEPATAPQEPLENAKYLV